MACLSLCRKRRATCVSFSPPAPHNPQHSPSTPCIKAYSLINPTADNAVRILRIVFQNQLSLSPCSAKGSVHTPSTGLTTSGRV